MTPYPATASGRRAAAPAQFQRHADADRPTGGAGRPSAATPQRQLYLALSQAAPAGGGADGGAAAAIAAGADWLERQLAAIEADASGLHLPAGAAMSRADGQSHTSATAPTHAPAALAGAALPADLDGIAAWHGERHAALDEQYKQYIAERRSGAPRRLFQGRAHALYYLTALAPARLTDGAWLFGTLAHWDTPAYRPLIDTYLAELGHGVPDQNHVVIFQQLIDAHGCGAWQQLAEHHFHGGLAQLALAHHAERFLPELLGYNLGCEHAALDTLVAAFEMNELGIDPYYFTLHVSADNGARGHASMALQALRQLVPAGAAAAPFLRRVGAGLRLHALAPSAATLLGGFELHRELLAMLAAKHLPARLADGSSNPAYHVVVGGHPLGEWLANAEQVPALLATLERDGWVVRGGDAGSSRLWTLLGTDIAGDALDAPAPGDGGDDAAAAPLAGLFSGYELALLADWIGEPAENNRVRPLMAAPQSPAPAPARVRESAARGVIRHRFPDDEHGWEAIANELTLLEARVVASASKAEAIALLAALMAPSNHHSSTGLMATRMFSQLLAA